MEDDDAELIWEYIKEGDLIRKKVARSAVSKTVVMECKLDEKGREVEKVDFAEDGSISKKIIYEYDHERRPRIILVYDNSGKLIWRHLRGQRPEDLG